MVPPGPPPAAGAPAFRPRWDLYAIAVGILVFGVVQQYVVPTSWYPPGWGGFLLDLFLVYGLGGIAFFVAFGVQPIRRWASHSPTAVKEGLRWYGTWGVLGWAGSIGFLFLMEILEPARVSYLLSRSTPVIQAGMQDPLFYIVFSFIVGVVEETLFRGYVLGTVLRLDGTKRWKFHCLWASFLFAGVHIYYAQTYEEISWFAYLELASLGLSYSFAYVRSGGNVMVVALLHGIYDASSYLSLIHGYQGIAEALTYGLLFGSGLFAVVLYMDSLNAEAKVAPAPGLTVAAPAFFWSPAPWTNGPAGGVPMFGPPSVPPPPPPGAVPPAPPGVPPVTLLLPPPVRRKSGLDAFEVPVIAPGAWPP